MSAEDDILKTASRLFSKVGSSVKRATKAVTGKGLGTVRIALERNRFAPGDEIRGKLVLALPEPIEARRLVVSLRASQRTVDYQRSGGVRTVETTSAIIYRFDQELGGARRYTGEQLELSLVIPKDAFGQRPAAPAGTLGDVARAVSSVVSPTSGPIEWQVVATLEIPWSRNLEHSVDVSVG